MILEDIKKGMKCRVIGNSSSSEFSAWISPGSMVTVVGVYPHHVLVESDESGVRESYCINGLHLNLAPANMKVARMKRFLPWTEEDERKLTEYLEEGRPVEEIARLTGRTETAVKARIHVLRERMNG